MLSEMAVRQAKAKDKDYKLSDSEGLYLFVAKSGYRSWRLKYRFAGKERRLILGAYPEVSLKEARDRKIEARKQLAEGRDPGLEAKKAAIARAMSAANSSFFSREFSSSSDRSRRASDTSRPPNFDFHL
jgi:hypothetical protein